MMILAGLVAVGAVIRFWRLGHQSYWLDESYTVSLMRMGFGPMLSTIPKTETTPPLYYVVAWPWAHLFGSGESALRALSALFGTLAIPLAYRTARELFSERVALAAAGLFAINPFLVWYSQEARSYALLVLLALASVFALVRAIEHPTGRSYALWALTGVLALLTHYFAAFILIPEAIVLIRAHADRRALMAVAAPLLCGAALLPLALHQRASGHVSYIAGERFGTRLAAIPKSFVTGELGLPLPVLGGLAGVAVAAGVVLALTRADRGMRRPAVLVLVLAAGSLAVPLGMAAIGLDYVTARNVVVAYIPLALLAAAGFGSARVGRPGLALLGVVALVAIVVNAFVAYDPHVERDDWRGAARALGPARSPSVVVLTPDVAVMPLTLYAGRMAPLGAASPPVAEIDVLGNARPAHFTTPAPPAGFREVQAVHAESYELLRYRAGAPVVVGAAELTAAKLGTANAALLLRMAG